uniref:START domain-containing protein 10 n=1 Tax=Sphaerodactylus townsendi TaxID=933632 RepID=A0ACB8FFK2_9SAUR
MQMSVHEHQVPRRRPFPPDARLGLAALSPLLGWLLELMECKDVAAETLYDVLHDIEYRKKWDTNVIETFDIGKLTVNADVGYYSWKCPKPLKNRDVITLRSWLPMGSDYIIMNYSVKHPKYPPRKDMVRAVSIQTGYLVQGKGPRNCSITYLAQVDPKGKSSCLLQSLASLVQKEKEVTKRFESVISFKVEKQQRFAITGLIEYTKQLVLIGPIKAMKKMYKACLKYPDWKKKHNPHFKPWIYPEQSTLPTVALAELSIQHADSLENIDESSLSETKDDRAEGSDEDSVN